MREGLNEEKLRELYRGIKRSDELRTPSFDSLLRRAHKREQAHRRIRALVSIAAGVATMLVVVGVLMLGKIWDRPMSPESLGSITRWRSPTDFLLVPVDRQLLRTVPRLGDPLHEIQALTSNKTSWRIL